MYVPAVEKVLLKLLPEPIFPLSKLSSSAVTVCVMLSLLFHVTVVPAATVTEPGVKLMFTMLTVFGEGTVVLFDPLLFEHAIKKGKNKKLKPAHPVILLMFFIVLTLNFKKNISKILWSYNAMFSTEVVC